MVWTMRAEKNMVHGGGREKEIPEVMWKNALIGLPVISSLTDNAIHHPLGENTDKGKKERESEYTDDEKKKLVKRQQGVQWKLARPLHHFFRENEHSRVELMRC